MKVEPLEKFLRRPVWWLGPSMARKTWRPSLDDYDRGNLEHPADEQAA